MDSENLETFDNEEYVGENYMGEESFRTPTASSPDTVEYRSRSCISSDTSVLQGDYEVDSFKNLNQFTLAMIKPDGMEYISEIKKRIKEEGFDIIQSRKLQMSPEQASDFYYDEYGQPHFPNLVLSLCEGPVQVYVLRRKDAVVGWKKTCGPFNVEEAKKVWPESLRAKYGTLGTFKSVCHGSMSDEKAKEEIKFFFPDMILEENFRNKVEVEDYLKENVNSTLLEGLTQVCKNKPSDPILWLATWLLVNNPNKPKMAEKIALTPT